MRAQIRARLEDLRTQFETGQAELDKLERQRAYLHDTMLRIGGAIQVLEELLAADPPPDDGVAAVEDMAEDMASVRAHANGTAAAHPERPPLAEASRS